MRELKLSAAKLFKLTRFIDHTAPQHFGAMYKDVRIVGGLIKDMYAANKDFTDKMLEVEAEQAKAAKPFQTEFAEQVGTKSGEQAVAFEKELNLKINAIAKNISDSFTDQLEPLADVEIVTELSEEKFAKLQSLFSTEVNNNDGTKIKLGQAWFPVLNDLVEMLDVLAIE